MLRPLPVYPMISTFGSTFRVTRANADDASRGVRPGTPAISPLVIGLEARQDEVLAAFGSVTEVAMILDRALVILTNEAGGKMLERYVDRFRQTTLVITRGAAGARLVRPAQTPLDIAAPAVAVVDATGAGDQFAGTLCHGLATGISIEGAVRLATGAASESIQTLGAQGGWEAARG